GDITNGLRQAKTIAIQANNATMSPEQLQVLADQIANIRRDIRTSANTKIDGRYVFAGTNSDNEPFSAGPPISYSGNGTPLQVGVMDGQVFPFTVAGIQIMNSRGSTDLFDNLGDLETAIRAGDTAGMTSAMNELDADSTNIVRLRADMGSRINYL